MSGSLYTEETTPLHACTSKILCVRMCVLVCVHMCVLVCVHMCVLVCVAPPMVVGEWSMAGPLNFVFNVNNVFYS